jgi:hypothetical protein
MKKLKIIVFSLILSQLFYSCSNQDSPSEEVIEEHPVIDLDPNEIEILSLGDSYTSGHNVCDTCGFPYQLKDSLALNLSNQYSYKLDIIAELGLTTNNLLTLIERENLINNYDLVTLLTGVNNQYQNLPFFDFFYEFPELVNKSIKLAKGDKNNVIVISIPDYAYTPFGQDIGNTQNISEDINKYNNYIKSYCDDFGITFINVTDITRLGLLQPELVTFDTLNPSELAYTKFVERILPIAIEKLSD